MSKFVLKSKTILGVLLSILPQLAVTFGFTFTENDAVMLSESTDSLIQIMGAALAIYGRFKVEGKVHV